MNLEEHYANPGGMPLASLLTPWDGLCTERKVIAVITFDVCGWARFLSHAQLVRVFDRACIRACLPLSYSQGFNPRPRMSLPLPKSVGLATRADVLCARMRPDLLIEANLNNEIMCTHLQQQLIQGVVIKDVTLVEGATVLYPREVQYDLPLKHGGGTEDRWQSLMAHSELVVERHKGSRRKTGKTVDVRPYLKSITVTEQGLQVQCHYTPCGSIRVDELIQLLKIEVADLKGPITRTATGWQVRH